MNLPSISDGYDAYQRAILAMIKQEERRLSIKLPQVHAEAMSRGLANVLYTRGLELDEDFLRITIYKTFVDWRFV